MKPKRILSGWVVLMMAFCSTAAYAQTDAQAEDNAPQILTSDLVSGRNAPSDRFTADFVFVGTDPITAITIDGQPQDFEPGDTVMLSKEFVLTQDRTEITVTATDSGGHTRKKVFLVYRPGVEPRPPGAVQWVFGVEGRMEVDTNPTLDLSTPVKLAGVNVTGVVPDSEQTDTRTTLKGTAGALIGSWSVYGGLVMTRYGRSQNKNVESDVRYVGAGYKAPAGYFLQYVFTDITIGPYHYAQDHTLTPGYEVRTTESDGTTKRHRFSLDFTQKNFIRSDQKDGSQAALKWAYDRLDAEKQDSYRSLVAIGNATEGYDFSDYSYLGGDFDWNYLWDSGVKLDWGFGLQYRSFPHDVPLSADTPLGAKRVDNIMRFDIGPGYQFARTWSATFNYRYMLNVSNKAPYVRQIYGPIVKGVF